MKLLILTQKVDIKDSVLGFFHSWLAEFSKQFEEIIVICLEKGEYNLPSNISVYSLGKEQNADLRGKNIRGFTRIKYVFKFYKHIWRERKNDAVFIHMNQEYVLLGGLFWRLWRKRTVFWYNHTKGNIFIRIAMRLANTVCHTSPFAFTAKTKKSRRMPAGIDTEIFKVKTEITRDSHKILYIGRISPAKKVHVLIKAVEILNKERIDFTLNIFGEALFKDREYLNKLKESSFDIRDKVFFRGAIPNIEAPKIFNSHLTAINLTAKGNYDKTVLEAAACGSLPLVSSEAFKEIIPEKLFFAEDDSQNLADKIKFCMSLSSEEKERLRNKLRIAVVERESLGDLARKIFSLYS